jgi:hypothetical protein
MEERFGHDFGSVRIHTDARAAESARTVHALAYTVGTDVVFEQGRYRPETGEGKQLLAHELAHTIQQSEASPQGQLSRRALAVSGPEDAAEREADAQAQRIMAGEDGLMLTQSDVGLYRQGGPAPSPAPVTANKFPDCLVTELPSLQAAVTKALVDLDTAISKLAPRPVPTDIQDALWLAFRRNDEATADTVKAKLQAIRNGLPTATIECEQPGDIGDSFFCGGSTQGYTRVIPALLGLGNIHVCMRNWAACGADEQALIVTHEGSHRFNNTSDDGGYFDAPDCLETSETAGTLSGTRLDNADSYSCVVRYLTNTPAAVLASRAAEYRGTSLRLVQDPPGVIDLNGPDVFNPFFKVEGLPQSSGFKFRWVMADDSDRRYLLRAISGDDPFQFGDRTVTIIGSKTRDLLKSRGVRKAKVLCRVAIPAVGDTILTLPVDFLF